MKAVPIAYIKEKAADWVWAHTPCCREILRLLSQECETPLPWATRVRMRLHMLFCDLCTRYRHQLHTVNRLLAALSRHECDHGGGHLSDEARERIQQAMKDL